MNVYSLSTPAGDSLLDSEDLDSLFAALTEGGGLRLAAAVARALDDNHPEIAVSLVARCGVTLTIEEVPQ